MKITTKECEAVIKVLRRWVGGDDFTVGEGHTLYECPNCSHQELVYDNFNEETFVCPACGKEYGFVSWVVVTE